MTDKEARKIMDRIFNRHYRNIEDFALLPPDEQRFVAAKCPHLNAPEADDVPSNTR